MKRKNWKPYGNNLMLFCLLFNLLYTGCSFISGKNIRKTEYQVVRIDTLGAYLAITLISNNKKEYEIIVPQVEVESHENSTLSIEKGKVLYVHIKRYDANVSPVSEISEKLGLHGRDFIVNGKKYNPQQVYYYICW